MKRTTRHPIDAQEFVELSRSIVGLPITHSWRGAGSALFLELGRLHLVRRGLDPMGVATVMIEWSWRVERVRSIEVGSWSTERRMDAGIANLAGPSISEVSVTGRLPELVIALSDGRYVHSFMTADGQPSWVLFLPDGSWLTVERGRLVHDVQNRRRGRKIVPRPS